MSEGPAVACVVDAGALLGECPVWSGSFRRLYWADIDGRRLHAYDPITGSDESRELPGRPGSFVLTEEAGRFLVAMEHQLVWYDWDADEVTPWLEVEPGGTGNRLNDGRCDPAGRYWVGSMYEDTSEYRFSGMLHRIGPDASTHIERDKVGVSNGLAFAPDGTRMYWADTLHDTVWVADYDVDTGTRSNERVFIDFTRHPGRPDGACVDEDGCYWVACVYGWAVARFTPNGQLDRLVELPVERPTMPAFGGPDLDTMYVTSISKETPHPPAPTETWAGGLLAVDVGVRGVAEPTFGAVA